MKITTATLRMATALALGSAGGVAEEAQFQSGGKTINAEIFRPETKQRVPAVLVIHGASGPLRSNDYIRQLATGFAAQGYAICIVRYFDRTGTTYASEATIQRHYAEWTETLADAVAFLARDPGIDSEKIALLGYSLGGYLAVTQGARDPRIAAVIEIAGGLDPQTRKNAQRMSPTLILHGEADRRVPVSEARALEQWLLSIHASHETRLYPDEGHLLSIPAAVDALSHAAAFLQKYLR